MSLEQKIKALIAERATLPISNMDNGDKTPVPSGSSQDAQFTELSKDIKGDEAAAPVAPAEAQAQLKLKGDPKSVTTQAQQDALEGFSDEQKAVIEEAFTRKHFIAVADTLKQISDHKQRHKMADMHIAMFKKDNPRFDETRFREAAGCDPQSPHFEAVEAAELKADIAGLFEGVEVAEGFVEKATGLFEAAVVARVNSEVTKAVATLQEQTDAELKATKEKLAEEVDQYMTYVVEAWMKDNKLAVDAGLRTEVAEGFIKGLKDLFVESYIEVPEDKVDVLESLSTDLESTKSRLNEEIEKSIALSDKIVELERLAVLESASKGLAATDAERLVKLTEGVEFDSKEAYADKVSMIRETHFKAASKKSAEVLLAEQADGSNANLQTTVSESVQRYVNAINRNSRF